jgi:pseudoazurin
MHTIIKIAVVSVLALFINSPGVSADIIKIQFTKFDAYSNEIVHINIGDVVEWIPTNEGHNVEFLIAPQKDFLPKKSKMNELYSLIFEEPGIYVYGCTPHLNAGMLGLIVVNNDFHNIEHVNNLKLSPVAVSVLKKMLKKVSSMSNVKNISSPPPPTQ